MIKGLTSKMNKKLHTVEVLLTDTLVGRQLFFRPPSQNPVLLNSHTNSVFFHSHKQPAPVTDTIFTSLGCLLTRTSTVDQVCPLWPAPG